MLILTDISPEDPLCPEPAAEWTVERGAPVTWWRAEVPGPEGTRVCWRRRAEVSQIDAAMESTSPAPQGVRYEVWAAESGPAFRGNHGRGWRAEPGNLHLTIVPSTGLSARLGGIGVPALPVVALAEAARELTAGRAAVTVRWINDILADGAKVGGAISRTSVQAGVYERMAFGLGLNTRRRPQVPPTEFVPVTGDLSWFTQKLTPAACAAVLLETFDRWFSALCAEGEGPLVMAYTSLVGDVGRRVRLYADPPGAADLPARERDLLAEGVLEGIGPRLEAIIGGRRFGGGRLLFAPETAG